MTKEQYQQIRNNPNRPIEIWWEFFKEIKGDIVDLPTFERMFVTAIANEPIILSPRGPKKVTRESMEKNFIEYYDKKFNINEESKTT